MDKILPYLPLLLKGIPVTLQVAFLATLLAVPVAFVLALGRMSRPRLLRWGAGIVIETFRGTSALVQLFWAFYVLPFFGINLSPLTAAVVVLGLNGGSYFSEVVRSSLLSVPVGQTEAAIALHLPRSYRFFRIILPQALPVMLPPFGNTVVNMLKFTALVSLVTVHELTFRAGSIRTAVGESGPIYGVTLVIYFILALLLSSGVRALERVVSRSAGRVTHAEGSRSRRRSTTVPSWALGGR